MTAVQDCGFELDDTPYLAPSDYHLFSKLEKKQILAAKHSCSDSDIVSGTVDNFLSNSMKFFFTNGIQVLGH